MNWLAHVFLSEQKIDFQLGNYLADPLKGKVWEDATTDMIKGMKIHMLIDSYTDSNDIVFTSKNRLRENGLLKSIVMDLTYDYFLTKNWDNFCNKPLNTFSNNFYKNALNRMSQLPLHTNTPMINMIQRDLLNKYHTLDQLEIAFERMDKRLSDRLKKRDTASSYYEKVLENIDSLENDFLEFFPQLCKEVKSNINENYIEHWRI